MYLDFAIGAPRYNVTGAVSILFFEAHNKFLCKLYIPI